MATQLFVGSLPFKMTSEELEALFAEFGNVSNAKIINDRETGRSRGFGFVEFDSDDEAQAAIKALNGKDIEGRALTVNVARPREERR